MARPVWNGTVSFGLLNVPVQLYSAEKSTEDVHFRLLDARNKRPIRYERVNAETGKPVEWKNIVKAYEYEKGNFVVVPEEEIRKAAPEATETVEIEAFVEREAISPMYFEKPYYLVQAKKAEKGYVLLRETLRKTGRVGIAKVVIRTRQYLAAVMPVGNALVLNLMRFPQELVAADEFDLPQGKPSDYRIAPRELEMATQLLESMAGEWRAQDYRDDFNDTLHKVIENRIAREQGIKVAEPEHAPMPKATTNVVDFMALLKKSLESKGRGTHGRAETPPAARRSARKAPARRSGSHGHGRHAAS